MKTINILIIICSTSLFSVAQTSHIITAFDFGFAPENLTVAPGDTVFGIFNGYHSITEVSESDWDNNIANSNGGFWIGFGAPTFEDYFVVSETGVQYYICVPHAEMGMKGTFNVVDPTVGIDALSLYDNLKIASLGNGKYTIQHVDCDEFSVITTTGKTMQTIGLSNNTNQLEIDLSSLAQGMYLGIFQSEGKSLKVVKFLR